MSTKDKKNSKSGMLSVNATIKENRKARYEYSVEETFEAGLVLTGTEVKSLRLGQASIDEGYIAPKDGELWIFNSNISEYSHASKAMKQHDPKRIRKLLLNKREIDKLSGRVLREGYTIVPLKLFFDGRGRAKLLIGLAKGKKMHDKRETEKERDWGRQKQRLLREKN